MAVFPGSHYAVLRLDFGASAEEVRKAHRRLALKWHPDKVADPGDEVAVRVATQQFQLVQAAYEVLVDPVQREWYDEKLSREAAPDAPPRKQHRCRRADQDSGPAPPPAGWAHSEKASLNVPGDAPSIAAAIDLLPVSGGTIHVSPGTYDGMLVVAKPFVNIVCSAAAAHRAIVTGQIVFRECAMGARLQGLAVVAACAGGAIDLKGVIGNVTIEDCEVCNRESAGIAFEGCSGDSTILRCVVRDCRYDGLGLHLLKGATTHKGSIVIEDSTFEGNGYDGLYLGDPRFHVVLRRSVVARNARHGVLLRGTEYHAEEATVEGNGKEDVHREEFVHRPNQRGTQEANRPREVRADLPAGWRAFRTSDGLVYYYHSSTGATQWSMPREATGSAAGAPAAAELRQLQAPSAQDPRTVAELSNVQTTGLPDGWEKFHTVEGAA
eukprot:CAMPEP_0117518752 /NCGR_PEP_ID=MMETSP0784-20121206/32297_1 /TAXON_ID=39447 /ORGANISM="" /LENGTH=437 /DNA_ID=CAMNT_0005314689 /DNA_START=79 /DNA_END=1389 /DNA_ORIENTATION=+